MARLGFRRRSTDWPNLEESRVPPARQTADHAALPGCVPAFDSDYGALAIGDIGRLNLGQPLLQRRQILVIIAVIFRTGFKIGKINRH